MLFLQQDQNPFLSKAHGAWFMASFPKAKEEPFRFAYGSLIKEG